MKIKKFQEGGITDPTLFLEKGGAGADIITGGAQAVMGLRNLKKANQEFERARAAAPSLETPEQYYENYKNAYDAELARMETDAMQANLATSIQALQGAGGRALVGGLSASVAQNQAAQNRMLSQERTTRLRAGADLARAEERALQRKYSENVRQQNMAQAAASAARQNIASGLSNVATGVMFGGVGQIAGGAKKALAPVKTALDEARLMYLTPNGEGGADQTDNMTQFVNNFRQRFMLGDMTLAGDTPQQIGTEARLGIVNAATAMRPELSVTPEAFDMEAMNKARQQEFIDYQTSQALPRQKSTVVDGGTAQQNFRAAEAAASTPITTIDTTSEFIYDQLGQPMPNPNYNKSVSQALGVNTVYEMKQGGMMTKGEFNHASNPIDIVHNGVKVGEATGGEYILNPDQAAKIAKESSFARKLFRQFEKKAKSNK